MFRLLLLPRRECEGTGREWRWTSWMDIITVRWLDKSGKNLLNLNLTCSQGFLKSVGHLKNEEKVLQVKSNSSSYRDRKWTYIYLYTVRWSGGPFRRRTASPRCGSNQATGQAPKVMVGFFRQHFQPSRQYGRREGKKLIGREKL